MFAIHGYNMMEHLQKKKKKKKKKSCNTRITQLNPRPTFVLCAMCFTFPHKNGFSHV